MIGSFSNPIMCEGWGHEVRSASSLTLFFLIFLEAFFCFCPCTWMSTISYISQRLCLCVGWRDNGAVFLNAQSLFPFLSHIPPFPPLFLTSKPILSPLSSQYLTCTPHAEQWRSHLLCAILSPSLFSSPLFGYLSYLTPFLPHLSLLHRFVDSCGARAQKHPIHHPALHPP